MTRRDAAVAPRSSRVTPVTVRPPSVSPAVTPPLGCILRVRRPRTHRRCGIMEMANACGFAAGVARGLQSAFRSIECVSADRVRIAGSIEVRPDAARSSFQRDRCRAHLPHAPREGCRSADDRDFDGGGARIASGNRPPRRLERDRARGVGDDDRHSRQRRASRGTVGGQRDRGHDAGKRGPCADR